MKSAFEYLGFRRLSINYQSPPLCEADFSSTSEPAIVLEPFEPDAGPTGGLWNQDGNNLRLRWDTIPGALCYSLYRAIDPLDPYGEYMLVAECTEDSNYTLPILIPGDCGTFRVSAIMPNGETAMSDPIITDCEDDPAAIPYDTNTILIMTGGDNPSTYGEMLMFTAQVLNGDPANPPTGFVDFYVDDVLFSSQPLNVLLQASFSTNVFPIGLHEITARYLGDLTNDPSFSVPLEQTVNVNPGSACEQVGPVVPETFRVDIPDETVSSYTFHFLHQQDFAVEVPAGKPGIYQFRYETGAHGYRCPDGVDTETVQYTPNYQVWFPAFGSFHFVGESISDWLVAAWGNNLNYAWPDGYTICANIDPEGWGLNLNAGQGMCGWGASGSQEALVTANLTGGPEAGQENFCWESPFDLKAGRKITLRYIGPAAVPSCESGSAVTIVGDSLQFSFVRVARLITQPAVATLLNHPHLGNVTFTEKSYSEHLCDYFSQNSIGYSLLRGNTYAQKWQLFLPLSGGWVGEKLYGETMLGNYMRTSDPSTGPDCFVIV